MSVDAVAEQKAIIERLSVLAGGQVWEEVPEESTLAIDTEGIILPYVIVSFGSLFPQQNDRSIEGADQQPQMMPVIVECWAFSRADARVVAGAARTLLIGWAPPGGNASEIELSGGSWFQQRDGAGRPTRAMESVNGSLSINNSIDVP